MKQRDLLRLSVNSILHRQLRSWLTLLGVIIGVAAVVAIVSIGDGAQASVSDRLSGFGADILTLNAGSVRAGAFGGNFRVSVGGPGAGGTQTSRATGGSITSQTNSNPNLTMTDVRVVKSDPQVLAVNPIVSGREELVFLAEKTTVSIQGVDPVAWPQTSQLTLSAGRLLTASDTSTIVISERLAAQTFKQPLTLGRTVTINGKAFTIVGILAPSLESGGFDTGGVYMPFESAWDVTDVNRDSFSSVQIKISDPVATDDIVNRLTQSLMLSRRVTERNQDFSITSAQAIQEQISSVTQTLTLFLGAIAMVSLLVGAIGIANSMFTSVLEKTREIGIMKSLGATSFEVMTLFIIESALFGLAGGIAGVVLGTVLSFGFSLLGASLFGLGSSTLVTPQLMLLAVVLSTVIGVVAGVWPARAASQLRPIEALRYE